MLARRPRLPRPVYLAGYPRRVRRVIIWYDALSDWQRIQYVLVAIVFLVACAGYLLGLGSTILLHHVEAQEAEPVLAEQSLPTTEPTLEPVAAAEIVEQPTLAPSPTDTVLPLTATPSPLPATPTPFSAPVIAEQPVAPRVLPAAPVVPAPAAPVRAAPTPTSKPRNLEDDSTAVPAAARTPTPAGARQAPAGGSRPAAPAATVKPPALPTLRIVATATPPPAVNNRAAPTATTAPPARQAPPPKRSATPTR
jgi:hypothetical protein